MKFIEQLFAFLLETIKHFSPKAQFFILMFLLFIMGYVFLAIKFKEFRNLSPKLIFIKILRFSLTAQDLFFKKSFYESSINNVDFKDDLKNDLFKTLLLIKVNTTIETTQQWLKTTNFNSIVSNTQLSDLFYCNINSIINNYEKAILQAYITKYGEKRGKAFFEYVYNSQNGFKIKHSINVKVIYRNINNLISSIVFSKKQKIAFYLKQLEIALDTAILDCEKSFEKFNGKLLEIYNMQ